MIFNNYLNFCCFIFLVFLFLNFSSTLHHHRLPFFILSLHHPLIFQSLCHHLSFFILSLHHPLIFQFPLSSSPFFYLFSPPASAFSSYSPFTAPLRRKGDSNPRYSFPYTHFPGVRLKPLGHLSSIARTMYIWSFFVYKIHHAFSVLNNEKISVLENLFAFYCIYFSPQIFYIQFAELFHSSFTW